MQRCICLAEALAEGALAGGDGGGGDVGSVGAGGDGAGATVQMATVVLTSASLAAAAASENEEDAASKIVSEALSAPFRGAGVGTRGLLSQSSTFWVVSLSPLLVIVALLV